MDMFLGIDTGGTFTDCVALVGKQVVVYKCPSTPQNPAAAVLQAIQAMGSNGTVRSLVHGTTVGTNALLERKGANVVFLTTTGFKDILEIGRQNRPSLYDLTLTRPQPLVQSQNCLTINERIGANGKVIQPLLETAYPALPANTQAIAIGFLFSYLNPTHEQQVAHYYRQLGYPVSVSHEILPEYREYERFSTTVANAYLQPVMQQYLSYLAQHLPTLPWRVIQSNGGSLNWQAAQQRPVNAILSGPAGGALGALELGKQLGMTQLLTFDMGGTSTDVSLIDHQLPMTAEATVGGIPLKIPMIAIHTVGAGGGSMVRLDVGGALQVGPASAGADPGPMCYGQGQHLTVTDAQVFLGRIQPDVFLAGTMPLQVESLATAFEQLGQSMNGSAQAAALGVIAVANANMERALRVVSVSQGIDPAAFALFTFGGAGGLHACELAQQLAIKHIIVPAHAGVFSALGMLFADVVRDYSLTVLGQITLADLQAESECWQILYHQSLADFAKDGYAAADIQYLPQVDLRYVGQSFELTVPWSTACAAQFHEMHQQRYGYHRAEHPIELVQIRLRAVVPQLRHHWPEVPVPADWCLEHAWVAEHPVDFEAGSYRTPFYQWEHLAPGACLPGPAVIMATTSTVLLLPNWQLKVDNYLNLHLEPDEQSD